MSYFTHFSPSILHLWNLVSIWHLIQTSHISHAHQPHMATYAMGSIGSMFPSCLKTCILKVSIKCAPLGCSYLLTPHRGIHARQPFSCSHWSLCWKRSVSDLMLITWSLCEHPQGFVRDIGLILASASVLPPEICSRKRKVTFFFFWKVTFFVLIFVKIFAWPKRQPAQVGSSQEPLYLQRFLPRPRPHPAH